MRVLVNVKQVVDYNVPACIAADRLQVAGS